jgi:hypothetical protein
MKFPSIRRVCGVGLEGGAVVIVGESPDGAPQQECTFEIRRPGDKFDEKKAGGMLGMTPSGLVVYGSCFA